MSANVRCASDRPPPDTLRGVWARRGFVLLPVYRLYAVCTQSGKSCSGCREYVQVARTQAAPGGNDVSTEKTRQRHSFVAAIHVAEAADADVMPQHTTSQQLRSVWNPNAPPPRKKPPNKQQVAQKKKRFDPAKLNAAFEKCYRGDVIPDAAWPQFIEVLRLPLPTCFSFVNTGCGEIAPAAVQARFEALLLSIGNATAASSEQEGSSVRVATAGSKTIVRLAPARNGHVRAFFRIEAVPVARSARPLPWFAERRGWQIDHPRKELASLRTTCKELRHFLETHTQSGRINRQEAVSMLPPLLLRVAPGMRVLDLCAAPGSKTCLLLSQLARGTAAPSLEASTLDASTGVLGGCVVANEINPLRCNRLRVRMGRTRVPGQVLTCHPAQNFPGEGGTYDRVLCDVPCSGDGTLRKNPDIWGTWQPRFSASLHPLQLQILQRGLELLKPGGFLLYSTCSFSPVEGEAVVAAALGSAAGRGVSLVECNGALPNLKSLPGISEWRVTVDKAGGGIARFAEADEAMIEQWRLSPSLFPPANAAALNLHRCARICPHENDTGGFFVALLCKSEDTPMALPTAVPTDRAARTMSSMPSADPHGRFAGGAGGGAMALAAASTPMPRQPAAEYLAAHGVKQAVHEALAAVVAELPADPIEALSQRLLAMSAAQAAAATTTMAMPVDAVEEALPGAEEELKQLMAVQEGADDDEESGGGGGDADGDKPKPKKTAFADETNRPLRFTSVGPASDIAADLTQFYGLPPTFPWAQLLSAYGHTTSRRLYWTSADGASTVATPGLRVLAAGLKAFEKDDSRGVGCAYRLVQDGALVLLPYLGKRVLRVNPAEMAALIRAKEIEFSVAAAGEHGATNSGSANGVGEHTRVINGWTDNGSSTAPPLVNGARGGAGGADGTGDVLAGLRASLSALQPNGSCVVACDNGCGTARAAIVLMKFTDKAVLFITNGERLQLIDDLASYFGDPTLKAQLEPLPTAELARRAGWPPRPQYGDGSSEGISRVHALDAAVEAGLAHPRAERRLRGVPLPPTLCERLLAALRGLRWRTTSDRPGMQADEYLVLSTKKTAKDCGTRHPHYPLRLLCEELLAWYGGACDDPNFAHNAIAVTRNFVGSPHTDRFDTAPQLAVSLGDFTGGELCVEAEGGEAIDVVDTRCRIAKVDGRRVHWVRAFRGGERFSLIFYHAE